MSADRPNTDLQNSCNELYSQIEKGMNDIAFGNTRPFSDAMADIRSRRKQSPFSHKKEDFHLNNC